MGLPRGDADIFQISLFTDQTFAGTEADFEFWKTLTLPFARRHAKGTDLCCLHSSSRSLFSCSSYLLKVSNNFTLKCNLSGRDDREAEIENKRRQRERKPHREGG